MFWCLAKFEVHILFHLRESKKIKKLAWIALQKMGGKIMGAVEPELHKNFPFL